MQGGGKTQQLKHWAIERVMAGQTVMICRKDGETMILRPNAPAIACDERARRADSAGHGKRLITETKESTMSTMEEGDKLAQTVAKAPRVTLADLEAKIMAENYFQPKVDGRGALLMTKGPHIEHVGQQRAAMARASLECLTICILITENGFTLVGKSACASADNFDAELGRKFARDDAIRQLWAHEGYLLREKLSRA